MRMGTSPPPPNDAEPAAGASHPLPGAERKAVHNASSKVSLVVQRMLFPLLDAPMRTHVILDTEANQVELDLLDQVGRHKPALLDDQQGFIQHLQSLMDRYRRQRRGPAYERVSTAGNPPR
jgi:hypothetical protein